MKPFLNPAQSGKITPNIPNSSEKLVPSNANAYLKPPKVIVFKLGNHFRKISRKRWRDSLQTLFSGQISWKGKLQITKGRVR